MKISDRRHNKYGRYYLASRAVRISILALCLTTFIGCSSMQSSERLADHVSGTGELRLVIKFDKLGLDAHVYIDGDYVGKYTPDQFGGMTYKLPAGAYNPHRGCLRG